MEAWILILQTEDTLQTRTGSLLLSLFIQIICGRPELALLKLEEFGQSSIGALHVSHVSTFLLPQNITTHKQESIICIWLG